MHWVRIVGEAKHEGEGVVDVASLIGSDQSGVAGQSGSNADLLRAPIEIGADGVLREQNESANAGMSVVGAPGVRVASGSGAERKQRRTIAPVAADRQSRLHNEAQAVAQSM